MTREISEDQLQETILEACRAVGRRAFHTSDSRKQVRTPRGYQMVGDELAAGYPDLTLAPLRNGPQGSGPEGSPDPGEAVWAELKGPDGRLEQGQVEWLDDLPPHRAFVWKPEDLDDALGIVQEGHPPGTCRTCWTCSRDEIVRRVGVRKRGRAGGAPAAIGRRARGGRG